MATEDSGDLQIRSEEKDGIACEVPEVPVNEQLENQLKSEECTELKESIEMENSVSDSPTLEQKSLPQSDVKDVQMEEVTFETTDKTADTKDTENLDSLTEETTNSAEPSAIVVDESKQEESLNDNLERRRRGRRGGRGVLVRKLATLNLPDGIILVKDRRYTGYHCTYCNCVLRSLATVKAHVGGKWHKRTLHIKVINEDKKGKATTKSDSTSIQKTPPKVPLKSSLEEYLSTSSSTIVGLSYIIETQRPNQKSTFQCNLCEVSYDDNDIKDHISGIKHCLMYLKLVKPTQLAELLAKQLSKPERNKEIAKLSAELEKENGRGEVIVKSLQTKATTAAKQPGYKPSNKLQAGRNRFSGRPQRGGTAGNRFFNRSKAVGSRSNRPLARSSNINNRNSRGARRGNAPKLVQQRRRNEGMSPARKRQLLEREFQAQIRYEMGAQNHFFPGRWGMRNEPMNVAPYQNETNFYHNYPNFYSASYGERRSSNRQRYMNESYEQMGQFPERELNRRERYDQRQPYWSDRHDNYVSSRPRNYNSRSVSSMQSANDSNVPISALKRLAGFNVTSEEDAGVVINAINSLTNSFMNYKLRDLSGPVQQLLQKSLKGSDLTSLLNLPDNKTRNTRDRYGGRPSSSQVDRDWGISQIAKPKTWLF